MQPALGCLIDMSIPFPMDQRLPGLQGLLQQNYPIFFIRFGAIGTLEGGKIIGQGDGGRQQEPDSNSGKPQAERKRMFHSSA